MQDPARLLLSQIIAAALFPAGEEDRALSLYDSIEPCPQPELGQYAFKSFAAAKAAGRNPKDAAEAVTAALAHDPRIRAVVAMAPGDFRLFGADGIAAIDRPELLMTGGHDGSSTSDGDPAWAALDGADDVRAHLPIAGHQAFTDFSGLVGDPPDSIDPEEGWRIVRTLALAFVELHGRGDDAGLELLDGSIVVSDQVELSAE